MKKRSVLTLVVATLLVVAMTVTAEAQRQGGRQGGRGQGGRPGDAQSGRGQGGRPGGQMMMGRGGPGGGVSLLQLASREAVQKKIEALDDQVEKINKLAEELRGERPEGDRPNFRDMSEEERNKFIEEMRKRQEEQAKKGDAELAKILIGPQMEQLEGIRIQLLGTRALQDPKVAAKLKITADQKAKMEKLSTENREKMMEMFRSDDRENMREKMTELREKAEKATMAILTDAQKKQFEAMKGDPIDREKLFGSRGGGRPQGQGRGRPQGGQGGGDLSTDQARLADSDDYYHALSLIQVLDCGIEILI